MKAKITNLFDRLCDARSLIDRQKEEIWALEVRAEKLARERNELTQAINTLRSEPSGEVWVKQEYSEQIGSQGWFPAVTIGPEGKSMYSNVATLDRAMGWFWKNTFEAFVTSGNDYEIPACRLINIRTGHTIPLTLRAMDL
jgi:hypothetical protein